MPARNYDRGAGRALILASLRTLAADGWPVSVREIQRDVGYASPQSVHAHLCNLVDEGLVLRHPRSSVGGFLPVDKTETL